ncbi:MAG: hypothetical protein COV76_03470 [Candidatus Omnitrophica bacterium CG11_big_fil_rev_8_21_14_0_20_64_10]|nr:MAG: hypothetical protein COV76_03470 [Candidatus Omnitrophica bacterium CG11_big_fil_rev_8_21_14_0_20_64_10]
MEYEAVMNSKLLTLRSPVADWVNDDMHRTKVLDRFGIDSCCGGQVPLDEACRIKGLDPEQVVKAMQEDSVPVEAASGAEQDWANSLSGMVDHLESTHHAYLKNLMAELPPLMDKVIAAHSARHSALHTLKERVDMLWADLGPHMMKEERVLFPMIRRLDQGDGSGGGHCGGINNPIRVMMHEHSRAAGILDEIRQLTNQYSVPEDGCASWGLLVEKLRGLEEDLLLHMYKENEIVFPAALEVEGFMAGEGH